MTWLRPAEIPFEAKLGGMIDYVRYGEHYDADVEKFVRKVSVGGWPGPQKCADLVVREGGGESGRILDIACGTGYVGEAIFAATGRKIWGLDASEEQLAVLREKRSDAHVQIINEDMEQHIRWLPDGHFEFITCAGAPEMSERWLPEIDRLLSRTGRLIIASCNFPLFGKLSKSYERIGKPDWWEQTFPEGELAGVSITWMIVALKRRSR